MSTPPPPPTTDAFLLRLADALRSLDDADEIQAAATRVLDEYLHVERVKAEAALRESEREAAIQLSASQRFHTLSAELVNSENTEAVFAQVVEIAASAMDADCASLQLLSTGEGTGDRSLRLLAHHCFHPDSAAFWQRVDANSKSACGLALTAGERVVIEDVEATGSEKGGDLNAYRQSGIRAVQTTPLFSRRGRLLGAISTHWRRAYRPPQRRFESFDVVARHAADLIERAQVDAALRASEARLRAVATNLPQGAVFVVGHDLRYQLAQGESLAVAGFTPADVEGKTVREALGADLAAEYEPHFRMVLAGESFRREHESHGRHFVTHGVPLREADGQVKAALAVSYDITDRKTAEWQLAEARDSLEERVAERTSELKRAAAERQQLLGRLVSVQEEERQRLSRDLHDTAGQLLAGLSMALKAADDATGGRHLGYARRLADDLGRELHALAIRQRPTSLDDLGLEPALRQLVGEWSARTGISTDIHIAGIETARLPETVETAIYRVVQEALNNVGKHAAASRASVSVTRSSGDILTVVEDDGRGFDTDAGAGGRLGLIGMNERAALMGGTLQIESTLGGGTTLYLRIPIPVAPHV